MRMVEPRAPLRKAKGGCLSPGNAVGRLAWLSLLSGAAFVFYLLPDVIHLSLQ